MAITEKRILHLYFRPEFTAIYKIISLVIYLEELAVILATRYEEDKDLVEDSLVFSVHCFKENFS